MKYFTAVCLFAAVCSSLASPSAVQDHSLVRHRRQVNFDFFANTRKLIEELIANLNNAAKQARDAVVQFNQGLLEQAKLCREKFMQDLNKLRERVSQAIKDLQEKFVDSGSAVGECINSHRGEAEAIFHDAQTQTLACADSRIKDAGELIQGLDVLCNDGQEIGTVALAEMKNCTEQHKGNILGIGSCLGAVAFRTEIKGASFLVQSGLAIGRLNLYMATLPASLEVCAGSSLVNAGIGTARVLMEIGSCSTNSVLSNFGVSSSSVPTPISSASGTISSTVSNAITEISSVVPNNVSGSSPISVNT